jgi:NO-binding membrane sensor protein with MHYT domain
METLQGSYNLFLVALSVAIAVLGSYTALTLAGHIPPPEAGGGTPSKTPAQPKDRLFWIGCAAFAMGAGGIWSMHFIGMVAFNLDVTVRYDLLVTAASLVIAVAVTGVAFHIVTQYTGRLVHLITAGVVMGLGVAGMHYTGMAAMRIPAAIAYDPVLVAASVIIAIVASIAALWLSVNCEANMQMLAGALVMGLAVSGMHYTAMAAAQFTLSSEAMRITPAALSPQLLAYGVFLLSLVTLSVGISFALTRRALSGARRSLGGETA